MRMVRTPQRSPVAVAGVVVGLAGRAEVMRPVDLDDDGAAVADHDEVRAAPADVAESGPGRQEPAFNGTAADPYRSVPVVSAPRRRRHAAPDRAPLSDRYQHGFSTGSGNDGK